MYTKKGIWAPWWLSGQESSCNAGVQVQSLGQEDRLEKKWQPTPVFLPGTFHAQSEPGGPQSVESQKSQT